MFDVLLRRVLARIRDALPGHTTASRLMRQTSHWRHLPPQQRAAAYAQFIQTQQHLQQIHVDQKIAPKIINLLFKIAFSEPGRAIAFVVAFCALYLLLNP